VFVTEALIIEFLLLLSIIYFTNLFFYYRFPSCQQKFRLQLLIYSVYFYFPVIVEASEGEQPMMLPVLSAMAAIVAALAVAPTTKEVDKEVREEVEMESFQAMVALV
jgi:hypothetical protein